MIPGEIKTKLLSRARSHRRGAENAEEDQIRMGNAKLSESKLSDGFPVFLQGLLFWFSLRTKRVLRRATHVGYLRLKVKHLRLKLLR